MRKVFVASFLAVSIAATAGCQQIGISKQQAGSAIGVVAGVALGSLVGGGSGQKWGMAIGAVIGGAVGNKIGSMLDEQDRLALEARTNEVLNSQRMAGSIVEWKSERTGASAQITKGKEYTQTKTVELRSAPKIASAPNMKLIQEQYVSTAGLNVRSAPNGDAERVGGLLKGTEFTAVGQTGKWILVGRQGVTVGYVHKDYVAPKTAVPAKPSVNLDEMNVAANPETTAFDLDAIPDLKVAQVSAEATCRPITVSLKAADGATEQDENTFCKQANGTWELI